MRNNLFLSLTFCLALIVSAIAQQPQKWDVSVLYVGYDPVKDMPGTDNYRDFNSERYMLDYQTRWPAFNMFLNNRFVLVKSVDARDYKEEMSAAYDVTIFDEVPKPLVDAVYEKDSEGRTIGYTPAKYLSDNYSYATIFIGKTGPDLGRSLGSKLDWHCFCLDADAVDVQVNHTIFNEPVKVELTMQLKDTPDNFFLYPGGDKIPQQIPMWRVQGLGYIDSDYGIGMVSRSGGFLDSPDAEYIAGGNNTKNMEAVALGRHGNFFLWGFSGSPDYMTEEAQQVFANTVVYMKKFKNTGLIAKKMDDRITIRSNHLWYKNRDINKKAFEKYLVQWMEYKSKDLARKKELEAKKAHGITLNKFQQSFLDKMAPIPTLETWTEDNIGAEAFKKYGTDHEAYLKDLNANIGYYVVDSEKGFILDEDVKRLGVANNTVELLDEAVTLLKASKEKRALGERILKRYTEENFDTVMAWENWLKSNREKLFFTEAGGYKWLVNTIEK